MNWDENTENLSKRDKIKRKHVELLENDRFFPQQGLKYTYKSDHPQE